MPGTNSNFSIRIPEATREKLDALAEAVGRTRNHLVAEAIEHYVAEQSWQIAEIEAGLTELKAGEGIPHEQVMQDAFEAIGRVAKRHAS